MAKVKATPSGSLPLSVIVVAALSAVVAVPAVALGGALTVVLKVAVTAFAALIVTWHTPVPVQSPVQPANVEPPPAT